jgi:hypothetical protein
MHTRCIAAHHSELLVPIEQEKGSIDAAIKPKRRALPVVPFKHRQRN